MLGYYKKRLSKILIPYFVWSLIYTVVDGSYSSFLRNLLTANAISPFYYVSVYVQFAILTPLIGIMLKSKFRWIGWFVTPVSILFIRYLLVFMGVNLGFPFPGTIFLVWFLYYYLGMALENNVLTYNVSEVKTWIIYGFVLLLAELEGFAWFYRGNYDMANSQIRLTSVLTSTVACLLAYLFIKNDCIVKDESLLSRILIKIGDYSFGIFLAQILVKVLLGKIPGSEFLQYPVTTLLILVITTLFVAFGRKVLGNRISGFVGL